MTPLNQQMHSKASFLELQRNNWICGATTWTKPRRAFYYLSLFFSELFFRCETIKLQSTSSLYLKHIISLQDLNMIMNSLFLNTENNYTISTIQCAKIKF